MVSSTNAVNFKVNCDPKNNDNDLKQEFRYDGRF